jgi:hypothetical protein
MKQHELLKPRYKVTADYPFNRHFRVGDIITLDKEEEGGLFARVPAFGSTPTYTETTDFYDYYLDYYPHIFCPLKWWEERGLYEMPDYVKFDNEVYAVIEWRRSVEIECRIKDHRGATPARKFQPATKDEYDFKAKQKEQE